VKALIFGANGQDGHYLSEQCRLSGMQVVAVSRSRGDAVADVADYNAVASLIQQHQPGMIFHLAANSSTSHQAGFENHATISTGSLNVLEAVYRQSPKCKVFITGSGVQFENRGLPISETDPFAATSMYSVSRIHSVYAARYYRSLGMKAYVGYLFHHESPLRKPHHVSRIIVDAVRRIDGGQQEMIELGDISVRKEWTFAGDVARGILCLTSQEHVFEAVIGSGEPYSIEDWLAECFGQIGRNWQDFVRIKPRFSAEYKMLVSDPATIKSLGWSPQTSFCDLAKMMLKAQT
jgi:GDPmannose 4,6-dehydratase